MRWLLAITSLLVFLGAAAAADDREPPAKKELFAGEAWYKGQAGKEEAFEGVLRRLDRGKGRLGFGRFNPYRLVMKAGTREVYVGAQGQLLEPYVGKRVRLTGKAVDMEVEGTQHREIWPARLELVAGKARKDARREEEPARGRKVKVLAQGAWPWIPVHAGHALPGRQQQQLVIRAEEELTRVAGSGALLIVAQGFKVAAIDFRKQMLVAVGDGTQPLVGVSGGGLPSAPFRVRITGLEVDERGKRLTVRWGRFARAPTEIISHPLEVVLVERFTGEVRFERLPDSKGTGPDRKAGGGKEVGVLARAFWPDGQIAASPPRQWVVRSSDDLVDRRIKANEEIIERMRREQTRKYARALGVKALDFSRQMVIGVSGGVQRTGGYRVEITRVQKAARGGVLTVHWKLHGPKGGQPVSQALSHPAVVALVERCEGEVQFVPPLARKGTQGQRRKLQGPAGPD